MSDPECVQHLEAHLAATAVTGNDWQKLNYKHDNILHVAALFGKPLTIRWLIENVDKDESLSQARNLKGYTPLEVIQSALESSRTSIEYGMMTICMSDDFRGFGTSSVSCLSILKKLENPTPVQLLRLKYGCTCNTCLDGFMSPRMKFSLHSHAETTHDEMNMDIGEAELWQMWHECKIRHVVPDIRRNFLTNESLRRGFANIFGFIALCLQENIIPNESNVLQRLEDSSEWPPVTRTFLRRGGTVVSALEAVFECARSQDAKAGDGLFMQLFGEDVLALPECRNDHEFGFVALACGIRPI